MYRSGQAVDPPNNDVFHPNQGTRPKQPSIKLNQFQVTTEKYI